MKALDPKILKTRPALVNGGQDPGIIITVGGTAGNVVAEVFLTQGELSELLDSCSQSEPFDDQ